MRICSLCKIKKSSKSFYNTHYYCKDCIKIYQIKNKDLIKKQRKFFRDNNKDKIAKQRRIYNQNNKKMARDRHRRRYKNDLLFKIKHCLRSRFNYIIKNNSKKGSAIRDLGCSINFFKKYIESKFTKGMTWDNHGKWHLDHIIPLSYFNLRNRVEFLKAVHYTNIQPLWAIDNFKKSNKIGA